MKIEVLKEPEHRIEEDDDYGEFSVIITKIQQDILPASRRRRNTSKEIPICDQYIYLTSIDDQLP